MADKFVGQLFVNQENQGWSETYPLMALSLGAAVIAMDSLLDIRELMLVPEIEIVAYRISDPQVRGDSYVSFPDRIGNYGGGENSTTPNVCLEIRQEADALHRSTRYVHGIPDDAITNGHYNGVADYETPLGDYTDWLIENVGIMTADRTVDPPTFEINAITVAFVRGIWTRKVGRPFGVHRGRRLTAVSP